MVSAPRWHFFDIFFINIQEQFYMSKDNNEFTYKTEQSSWHNLFKQRS